MLEKQPTIRLERIVQLPEIIKEKKTERKKNQLRFVVKLQNENLDAEPSLEGQIVVENKGQEEILSPLKPQQLHFGSTSRISQEQAIQNPLTPIPLPISMLSRTFPKPPLPPPVLPIMMVNVHSTPMITNIVYIPYFLGRPGSDADTHL